MRISKLTRAHENNASQFVFLGGKGKTDPTSSRQRIIVFFRHRRRHTY